jgi:outer membrane protein TolC
MILFVFLCGVVGAFFAENHALAETLPPQLSVEEAVDIALAQHPTIAVGQATIAAAQQRVRQQEAGYLPQGRYSYTYTRQARTSTSATGGVQVGSVQTSPRTQTQLFNFNSMAFSLSQLLFDFGQTLDAIRSARASVEASTADLDTVRQTVIFTTKQAFFTTLASQRLLHVADETVRQNQKYLEDAQARFEVGLVPRFDVTQAQVQVSTAKLNHVTARNNVALALETLRTAMGISGPFAYALVDSLAHRPLVLKDEDLVPRAYANRPELRSVQAQQRATAEHVSSLQKQYLPSITGNAQYNWTGRQYPLQQGWLWGVTITVPLFDDILTVSQVGEAQANLSGLQAQEVNLRQQILLEVRQSVLTAQQADESVRVSEETVGQARENLALAEGRYAAGVGNIIELTDAQVSLTTAQASHIQALTTYKTAIAQVEKAINQRLE